MEKAADAVAMSRSPSVGSRHREPDEAVEKVVEYVSYGLNHLVFHAPGHDQRRFLNFSDLARGLCKLR